MEKAIYNFLAFIFTGNRGGVPNERKRLFLD
jgi:hypothetical protein